MVKLNWLTTHLPNTYRVITYQVTLRYWMNMERTKTGDTRLQASAGRLNGIIFAIFLWTAVLRFIVYQYNRKILFKLSYSFGSDCFCQNSHLPNEPKYINYTLLVHSIIQLERKNHSRVNNDMWMPGCIYICLWIYQFEAKPIQEHNFMLIYTLNI